MSHRDRSTSFRRARRLGVLAMRACLVLAPLVAISPHVHADAPTTSTKEAPPPPPDEAILGTIEVTGDASAPPLPKLAVMPLTTTDDADATVQEVVRGDLDLSGQFDVLDAKVAPDGALAEDTAVDAKAWRGKGVEILVRVLATPNGSDQDLTGEAYLLGKSDKSVFTKTLKAGPGEVRMTSHRLTDLLLGALTGTPGGFASHLAYAGKVKAPAGSAATWSRQVIVLDADGHNAVPYSDAADTAISPAFGPSGEIYYAISHDYGPFKLVHGTSAKQLPLQLKGNVLGVAFSHDHKQLALSVMDQGSEDIYVGQSDGTMMKALLAPPLASHPSFGSLGKLAYVAGSSLPQVYVDGKIISPPGFHASAPSFCDTPRGLLVIFTVGVGANADIIATDTSGGGLIRLTQNQGANAYPACSPDGRLVAFFSTRTSGKGPGLYVMPIASPWRSQRISGDTGDSLRWEAIAP